ncbi:MAG: AAA family ATPase [Alphaproteobacteria bacterium]|nr:AAA family ATPase [Alphaproteobacteria bacterium]
MVLRLRAAVEQAWRGRTETVDLVLAAVLAGGHVLLQDVPGVGKTTLAAALARATGGSFHRIQLTADLLPGDLTGVPVLGPGGQEPVFRPGPLFAHVVLADELNRATPRTQAALLEAMAEGSVSVDGVTHRLPRPFLVLATQNPYDVHGTYPLPDSQLDRFLLRLSLGYPSREDEQAILHQPHGRAALPDAIATPEEILAAGEAVEQVRVEASVEAHLLDLVWATRRDARLLRGVSPRGAQALHRAARARALVAGREFVVPDDVRRLAVPVLAHRVVPRGAAEDAEAVIAALVRELAPPT